MLLDNESKQSFQVAVLGGNVKEAEKIINRFSECQDSIRALLCESILDEKSKKIFPNVLVFAAVANNSQLLMALAKIYDAHALLIKTIIDSKYFCLESVKQSDVFQFLIESCEKAITEPSVLFSGIDQAGQIGLFFHALAEDDKEFLKFLVLNFKKSLSPLYGKNGRYGDELWNLAEKHLLVHSEKNINLWLFFEYTLGNFVEDLALKKEAFLDKEKQAKKQSGISKAVGPLLFASGYIFPAPITLPPALAFISYSIYEKKKLHSKKKMVLSKISKESKKAYLVRALMQVIAQLACSREKVICTLSYRELSTLSYAIQHPILRAIIELNSYNDVAAIESALLAAIMTPNNYYGLAYSVNILDGAQIKEVNIKHFFNRATFDAYQRSKGVPNSIPLSAQLSEHEPKSKDEDFETSSSSSSSSSSSNPPFSIEPTIERKELLIQYNRVKFIERIGMGHFGEVYRGVWAHKDVAIKKLFNRDLTGSLEKAFAEEANVMLRTRHPNVIILYGIIVDTEYCLVLEYMAKGSLYGLLHSEQPLSWELLYIFVEDIAKGMVYLHGTVNILHRDLNSNNIFGDDHNHAKLADFGLAKIKQSSSRAYDAGRAGTTEWIAPELFSADKPRYTKACDVYSFGMVLWELMTRQRPYNGIPNRMLVPIQVMQGKREEIPSQAPQILQETTADCWAQEPGKRPTMEIALNQLQAQPVADTTPIPSPHIGSSVASSSSFLLDDRSSERTGYLPSPKLTKRARHS